MPPLQQLKDQLAEIRREAEEVTGSLSNEQLNWSPSPGTWSIALCLDHLNRAGYQLLPGVEKAIDQLRSENRRSEGPFRYGWLERFFIRMVSPNPPFKVPVPPTYLPQPSDDPQGCILPRFFELQDSLVQCLEEANGLDLKGIKIPSPANGRMTLSLGAWLEGTVMHEQYHWLQAKALRSHPNFPAEGR